MTFSSAVSVGSRLKNWKMKPMWSPAQLRELGVAEARDLRVADCDLARRPVKPGEDVHQRGLARSRRAHDGGELPAFDLERDATKRLHARVAVRAVAPRVTSVAVTSDAGMV